MLIQQVLLAVLGLSAGLVVAGGLFSFIVELGVVADFADRTHTGGSILFYEDCVALGGILGNLFFMFCNPSDLGQWPLLFFGLFSGIFTGCWAMALAENLNVFPVFIRRAKLVRFLSLFILMVALGRGIGALIFFFFRW